MASEPRIWIGDSRKDGGCNFCSRHVESWGDHDAHPVIIVEREESGGLQCRFCFDCARHFRVQSGILERGPDPLPTLSPQQRRARREKG